MREFFYMGGYGFYVWSAYGLSLVVLALNAISARRQIASTRENLKRESGHGR